MCHGLAEKIRSDPGRAARAADLAALDASLRAAERPCADAVVRRGSDAGRVVAAGAADPTLVPELAGRSSGSA